MHNQESISHHWNRESETGERMVEWIRTKTAEDRNIQKIKKRVKIT